MLDDPRGANREGRRLGGVVAGVLTHMLLIRPAESQSYTIRYISTSLMDFIEGNKDA